MIASRPLGSSSSTDRSRSPKTTIAAVRGIGVAVMTSRSGSISSSERPRPLSRSAARCSTPKRCCSSITTAPRARKCTSSVSRACVPTTMSTEPRRSPSSTDARSLARSLPVSSWIDSGLSPPSTASSWRLSRSRSWRIETRCCSARTSVGAIRAPWRPPSIAASNAVSATMVLPDPTSPWSRRCIGSGDDMSPAISPSTRRWAPVSVKRCPARKRRTSDDEGSLSAPGSASRSSSLMGWATPAAVSSRRRRRIASSSCRRRNSSKASRRRAGATSPGSSGRWIPQNDRVRSTRSSAARTASGTGSSSGPARRRDSSTKPPISQLVSPALPDAG